MADKNILGLVLFAAETVQSYTTFNDTFLKLQVLHSFSEFFETTESARNS
jgi:hypothetical protein